MTLRRFAWIFAAIALGALLLAAAGHWLLHWPRGAVHAWLGIGAGYLLGALLMSLMPRWWREHCDEMYAQPAGRRYRRALWPIMIGYALVLFASISLIRHGIESVPLRALVAVTPALAIALLMRAALRYLREVDELQRRIETESIGIASLLVALLYFAGGLLEKAEVLDFDAASVMIWVFPLLCLTYGIAKMVLTRRYL
ncbi:conserved membrane hypothetical protein [uncultured Stenotrophomonas sp.]|uniref:Transmembrane protein n=1 Tax=uncultured Stenotrophomonas sp. TaxID=165438 RepID=A0A1Y5Q4K1_9GAMM|nr:conserved membrane hypothetical protein [uncultured Stenotrophomonas sp.]